MFQKVPVEGFSDPIVLRRVMCCEMLFHSLLMQETRKVIAGELSPPVGSELANNDTELCECPSGKGVIRSWDVGLLLQHLSPRVPRIVISKGDIVLLPTDTSDWGGAPNV